MSESQKIPEWPDRVDTLVAQRQALLQRIADALGRPTADFGNLIENENDFQETSELLGIWVELADRSNRLKILTLAQRLAATEAKSRNALKQDGL